MTNIVAVKSRLNDVFRAYEYLRASFDFTVETGWIQIIMYKVVCMYTVNERSEGHV